MSLVNKVVKVNSKWMNHPDNEWFKDGGIQHYWTWDVLQDNGEKVQIANTKDGTIKAWLPKKVVFEVK